MISSIYKTIFFYIAIESALFFNGQIRNNVDKYLRQIFLKEKRNTTNFFIHFAGVITTITKITSALVADTTFGSFKTWLFLFPFIFVSGLTNIFSIFANESRRLDFFKWTKLLYSFIGSGISPIMTPFFRYQMGDRKIVESFFNISYYTFNVSSFIISLFVPSIFKKCIKPDSAPLSVLWFILPPFTVTMLSHIVFFLFYKTYKKEVIVKKNLLLYVKTLFYPEDLIKNQLKLHYTQLKYLISLFFVKVTWSIVVDLLNACLIDFADDARGMKINMIWYEYELTGQSLEAINEFTVLVFTPIMLGFLYPYIIPKYSDYRKLIISLIINTFSIALGGFLHCINPQKGCIDKSITHSIMWHGLVVHIQTISEIIVCTTLPREVAKHSPTGYTNLCFALLGASYGVSSFICMIVTKCEFIKSVNKISVYIIITLPGPYFAYKAYQYNKDINEIESKIESEKEEEKQ